MSEAWLNADYWRLSLPVEPPPIDPGPPIEPEPPDPDTPLGYSRLTVINDGTHKYMLLLVAGAYKRVLMGVADG